MFPGDLVLNRKVKLIVVSVLIAVIVGLTFFAYAQRQFASVTAQTSSDDDHKCSRPPDNRPPDNRPANKTIVINTEPEDKTFESIARFLRNATAVTVSGTVVMLINRTLLLRTDSTELRIVLPNVWSFNYSIVSRYALFNETFTGVGQNVTVHALKSILFDAETFDVNVMFGYEIMNTNSKWAFAVLPFNIEIKP
jgi:hypothetical protein